MKQRAHLVLRFPALDSEIHEKAARSSMPLWSILLVEIASNRFPNLPNIHRASGLTLLQIFHSPLVSLPM